MKVGLRWLFANDHRGADGSHITANALEARSLEREQTQHMRLISIIGRSEPVRAVTVTGGNAAYEMPHPTPIRDDQARPSNRVAPPPIFNFSNY